MKQRGCLIFLGLLVLLAVLTNASVEEDEIKELLSRVARDADPIGKRKLNDKNVRNKKKVGSNRKKKNSPSKKRKIPKRKKVRKNKDKKKIRKNKQRKKRVEKNKKKKVKGKKNKRNIIRISIVSKTFKKIID